MLDRLDLLCERTGLGRAELVERCLTVGLTDEEELVAMLESPLKGPLLRLLLSPGVLKQVFGMPEGQIDPTQQKVRGNVSRRRRAKPVVE